MAETIVDQKIHFKGLAAVANGGIAHTAALARMTKSPMVTILKEPKIRTGLTRVEGLVSAKSVYAVVDDIFSTGGSTLNAVAPLKESRALVKDALSIVTYDLQEAQSAFKAAGINNHSVVHFPVLFREAKKLNLVSQEAWEFIPRWAEQHSIPL